MQKHMKSAELGENHLLDTPWTSSNSSARKELLQTVRALGAAGEFICELGEKIPQILLQDGSSFPRDESLDEFYRVCAPLERSYIQSARLVDILAHENPRLRVLEIRAGTGEASWRLLETLVGIPG